MRFFLSLFIILFLLSSIFINFLNKLEKEYQEKFYPNIYIDYLNIQKKTREEVINRYLLKKNALKTINIEIFYKNEPIATFSGQTLNINTNGIKILEQAYLIGRHPNKVIGFSQKILAFFNLRRYDFHTQLDFDQNIINEFINVNEDRFNKPAKNALFKFENNRVINFRKEEPGLKILSEEFQSNFKKSVETLRNSPNNKRINLTDKVISPEITLAKANQFGIEEFIGEGKSDFSHSIQERIHNIVLASSKFNGVLIPKDKIFSFNEIVGDISSLTGYKPAYIIKEGKTVLGDGGGVCQVSTTFFRAALNTGLPIIERYAHAYRVSYYENDAKPGLDATVYAPTADLKIKNDTSAYILIQTEINNEKNQLFFKLYGKKDDRKIEISPVSVFDVVPPLPAKYQDDPTLKKGVIKQVDFPAWGSKAKFEYKVIKNNQIVFEKTFFSAYRPWQAVYLVGVAE